MRHRSLIFDNSRTFDSSSYYFSQKQSPKDFQFTTCFHSIQTNTKKSDLGDGGVIKKKFSGNFFDFILLLLSSSAKKTNKFPNNTKNK